MNEEFILKLFEKFEKGKSVSLHLKEGETEFVLKKEGAFPKAVKNAAQPALYPPNAYGFPPPFFVPRSDAEKHDGAQGNSAVSQADTSAPPAQNTASCLETADKDLVQVKSPIVGTFYRAPSPDSPAYVEKGSTVKKGQPLCVLEAMKMMNTLESEFDGVIEDIAVSNGDLVEFDQLLFTVRIR